MGVNVKRILPILPQLKQIIASINHSETFHAIINAILVITNAQGAWLNDEELNKRQEEFVQSTLALLNSVDSKHTLKLLQPDTYYVHPEFPKKVDDSKYLQKMFGHYCSYRQGDNVVIELSTLSGQPIFHEICHIDFTHWDQEVKKIQAFLLKKAARFNKVLGLFNLSSTYNLKYYTTPESRLYNLNNDRFVNEFYDKYVNDIFNSWTKFTLFGEIATETWEDVKTAGLTELFRFVYSAVHPVDAFMGVIHEIEQQALKSHSEDATRRINKFEKEVAQFELELSQSNLLRSPYKTWRNSLEYRTIVNRQPDRLRKAMDRRWRLFGV